MNTEINDFLKYADIHASTDYENRTSVKAGNQAADSMKDIANRIAALGRAEELLKLLSNEVAGAWVAYTLADSLQLNKSQKKRCIKHIQNIAAGGGLDSMGAEMWLKERGYRCS